MKLYCEFCGKKVKSEMKAHKINNKRIKIYCCPYCGTKLKTEIVNNG